MLQLSPPINGGDQIQSLIFSDSDEQLPCRLCVDNVHEMTIRNSTVHIHHWALKKYSGIISRIIPHRRSENRTPSSNL